MILTKYKEYVTKYNLKRFVNAHRNVYASALKEIQAGSHIGCGIFSHNCMDWGTAAILITMVSLTETRQ